MTPRTLLTARLVAEGGHCWRAPLPDLPQGDCVEDCDHSRLVLLEDGLVIGQPHALHDSIRSEGNGLFSHWLDSVWFSTSDNSDPRVNGRTYAVAWDVDAYLANRSWRQLPRLTWLLDQLPGGAAALAGRRVLELGPGGDHDSLMLLAGLGAKVLACDRGVASWRSDWHPPYLRGLSATLSRARLPIDAALLTKLGQATGFEAAGIQWIDSPAEMLPSAWNGAVDVHLSHATFEHFRDVDAVVSGLARLCRRGGLGVHLVDFVDHRDSTRPLEFLLMDDASYDAANQPYRYIWGNRVKPSELIQVWRRHGFAIRKCEVVKTNPQDYLEQFLPRLRASSSRFQDADVQDLVCAHALIVVEKI